MNTTVQPLAFIVTADKKDLESIRTLVEKFEKLQLRTEMAPAEDFYAETPEGGSEAKKKKIDTSVTALEAITF